MPYSLLYLLLHWVFQLQLAYILYKCLLTGYFIGGFYMPTYDFECDNCGRVDEYYTQLTTSIPEKCACGKKSKLNKVETFTSSKPVLTGNGFYETDYKNKTR